MQRNSDIGKIYITKKNLKKIKNLNSSIYLNKKLDPRFSIHPIPKLKKTSINFKRFNPSKPNEIQKIIYSLKNKLKNFVFDIIIHGSYGDETFIKNWSDLDVMIIVKDSVILNKDMFKEFKSSLLYCQKKLYKVFPLQHHPFQIICESFLLNYDQSIMPLAAFSKSKSLINKTIKFEYIENNNNKKILLDRFRYIKEGKKTLLYRHHCKNNRCLDFKFQNRYRLYQLFAYMNYLLLIPSLFLGYKKKNCHKSKSFKLIKNFLKENDLKILLKISNIRNVWKYKKSNIKKNYITNELANKLGKNFYKEAYLFEKKITSLLDA